MMLRHPIVATLITSFAFLDYSAHCDEIDVAPTDWAWWRGPSRNGVADPNQSPPLQWSETTNVLWKQAIPGRGHGSPIVVGDRIFLATADEDKEIQSVLCYNSANGALRWKTDVHSGGFAVTGRQGHPRSTRASSTLASDGHRVFVNFFNDNAVFTTAIDLNGDQLWQQKVSDYVMHQGYGSSPAVYGPLVIVSADNKGGGAIRAFDRVTGEPAWTVERAQLPNYASPIVLTIDHRDQLLFTGHDLISSFDPLTGKVNWEVEGSTVECVTSVVTDGKHIVSSGGYPDKHIAVVSADGKGKTVWRNTTEVYVPSMLVYENHLYGVTDRGEAFCYSMTNEAPRWQQRLRARFSASPVLVGENIYATSGDGVTYVFKATPEAFELIAENEISADEVEATPAICDGKIYFRLARKDAGMRQELLYCIGTDQRQADVIAEDIHEWRSSDGS